jgi:serine/threonine protein kinase
MNSLSSNPIRIGAYDIVEVIGRGGMGTVYKAMDPRIDRPVAIKVLTAAADDPDLLIRFYREAKYTGSLQHQNIVTVYELGHQDGIPYLVMEYLEGVSLDAVISTGRPMPMAQKLGIILQVCSGLTYAHNRDLVHRDIKPANIVILESGTAKIVDFGIARLGGNKLTRTGHIVGSLNYMSPEQLGGTAEVDLRTDVYSTGVVLFQLLTGVLPFAGDTTAATLRRIVLDPAPTLGSFLKDCPPDLEATIQKALAKKPEDRYNSAEDFAVDVARLQQQYERHVLADHLQQAAESLTRKDFPAARQYVLQALRIAPQSVEGADLLRLIRQGQEQQQRELHVQQREQQITQFQMKAEESFRKSDFRNALQFVEQGLQIDSSRTAFLSLRDAIFDAQTKTVRYSEALKRAEAALRSGDLETAKEAIDEAIEIMPDDAESKGMAAQISMQIEQTLQEQKAVHAQRQVVLATNTVEKALADARMHIFLGRAPEALKVLDSIENELSQLPLRWREQAAVLRQEALSRRNERSAPSAQSWEDAPHRPTSEISASFQATVLMQPGPATPKVEARQDISAESETSIFPARPEAELEYQASLHDVRTAEFSSASHEQFHEQPSQSAHELLEFLEPERPFLSRPKLWLGIAVAMLFSVFVWLIVRPRPQVIVQTKPAETAQPGYTYAELNAEPWATIKAIEPASGEAGNAIGSETPLRVKLPPGQYNVTFVGPGRQQKRIQFAVPQQGGTSCFVVFRKPDLNRILNAK